MVDRVVFVDIPAQERDGTEKSALSSAFFMCCVDKPDSVSTEVDDSHLPRRLVAQTLVRLKPTKS